MPNRLRHELLSASAGSGKTYQLVRRYLHLLALGVDPQTIVAMTFTRKAAGEFFIRILRQLADLANRSQSPEHYFADLQPPVPADVDYLRLLRRLTRRMHRLRLGTLDSFFASVATCFPLELGLPPKAAVMDENESARVRDRVLDHLLDQLHRQADSPTRTLLTEAIKKASFGAEDKRFEDTLRQWLIDNHDRWADTSGAPIWGEPQSIWGPDHPLRDPDLSSTSARLDAVSALRDHFPPATTSGTVARDDLLEAIEKLDPGPPLPKAVATFLEKSAQNWADLQSGSATFTWGRRPTTFSGPAAAAWVRLASLLVYRDLLIRCQRTRGLASFLQQYESCYHAEARSQGRLSFADIPRLLRLRGSFTPSQPSAAWLREDLWFRLDARFAHWMLDEFQDTSHVQWQVTHRLVDEVLQDTGGDRSFFAVGDTKQSIYLWRHAEPRVFNDLRHLYPLQPDGSGGIHVRTLSHSYRSAQPVLDAVNRVFADTVALDHLFPGVSRDWDFHPHIAARPQLNGCVRFLSTLKPDKNGSDDDTLADGDTSEAPSAALNAKPSHRAVATLLREIDPLARGLSCAVLVRSNQTATTLTEVLRQLTGMNVVSESQLLPLTDNAVTLALLSLLQVAAHPGDSLAAGHLRMTPLVPLMPAATPTPAASPSDTQTIRCAARETAATVFDHGFTAWLQLWITRLHSLSLDAFHQLRLRQFLDFASSFDKSGSRDIDEFLAQARQHSVPQSGTGDAVQVMTIHKSKGLEFDVVILPDLAGSAMDEIGRRPWIVCQEQGETRWVLQSPPKDLIALDPTLSAEAVEARRESAFESLCRLYVAMTRAKHGLYFVAGPPPKTGSAMKTERFLRMRLASANPDAAPFEELHYPDSDPLLLEWQTGDPEWHLAYPLCASPAAAALPASTRPSTALLADLLHRNQPRQRRRTPSGEETFHIPGRVLFSPGRDTGRHLGSRVHEMMALVEWWEPGSSFEALIASWKQANLLSDADPVSNSALSLLRPVLTSPLGHQALGRPQGHVEVWREKPFDFMDHGDWVSGVFDRVVLVRDDSGHCISARILDFKTDDAPDAASLQERANGYQPQLALYRRAIARLTRVPASQITTELLFLRPQKLVEIPA